MKYTGICMSYMFHRRVGKAYHIFYIRSQSYYDYCLNFSPCEVWRRAWINRTMSSTEVAAEEVDEATAAKRPKIHHDANRRAPILKNNRRDDSESVTTYKSVHKGSYADPEQRELFSVALPPDDTAEDDKKRSKKKVAILLGYVGTNYGGFQINPGVRSIQAELELALVRVGLLRRENFGYPHKYSWSTSGRTDKGVHAAAQTVSLKIEWPAEKGNEDFREMQRVALQLIPEINSALPDDIRVLDLARTTRPFVAKTHRDRVRYRYMIPSFCLYERQALKMLLEETITSTPPSSESPESWRISQAELQQFQDRVASYRVSMEQQEKLQMTLQQYIGTHSFHNFTRRCQAGEPRAKRYILNFEVEDPVLLSTPRGSDQITMEWIPTTVTGQSFLLNQIRKMIYCAVEVARGALPDLALANYLHGRQQGLRPLGLAPAQGLFLDMSIYEKYNSKVTHLGKQTEVPLLEWFMVTSPSYARWKHFRDKVLVPHVAAEEITQGNFVEYLFRLENPKFFHYDDESLDGEDDDDDDDRVEA